MTRHATPSPRRWTQILSSAAVTAVTLSAITAAGLAPAASAADLSNQLILEYSFEEGQVSGASVKDLSSKALNGEIANPANASYVEGRSVGSKAIRLPGGAAGSALAPYVTVPKGLFQGVSSATISAWVKWDGGADFQWLYSFGRGSDSAAFYTPSFADDARSRTSIKQYPTPGREIGARSSGKLPQNEWVNIVTRLDGTSIDYFLNGIKVDSQPAAIDISSALYSADSQNSGYIGQPFWKGIHPFFAGAIDDIQVYSTALTDGQIAGLQSASLPTATAISSESFSIGTKINQAPALPSTVDAKYSDGVTRPAAITWAAMSPTRYAQRGTFIVEGVVPSFGSKAVRATVTVSAENDFTVDLSSRTGSFLGGASGTLYGVYGDGLPSQNLLQGINLRTVATKAQDGLQHPGADGLEVAKALVDATGSGDTYIYMTDIYRGAGSFWPGDTPYEQWLDFKKEIEVQVRQVLSLDEKYRKHVVFIPFNEPEGVFKANTPILTCNPQGPSLRNMTDDPTDFLQCWDEAYRIIKNLMPDARVAGPNTQVLRTGVPFLQHAAANNTMPDEYTWHELGAPDGIRSSVAAYRTYEKSALAGTAWEGKHLRVNINEYAHNYHTSVPGQMIQWVSAIEDAKVDADIAYWNIDGNLSDSAVQSNRGNGQWWLLHAYSQMTGETVKVTPPRPNESYTLQGLATIDDSKRQSRILLGGASGSASVRVQNVNPAVFGQSVRAVVSEIRWTGQIGDSGAPLVVREVNLPVVDGSVALDFGSTLPAMKEASAYQIVISPAQTVSPVTAPSLLWSGQFEAEDAGHTGAPYYRNGPEGSPTNVGGFYTSNFLNIGGLETGSSLKLDFAVDVPQDGTYDLSVFANSLSTAAQVANGPTNVFITVDGKSEQEMLLPLGYKWLVWDHSDAAVQLSKGAHTISLSARSLDGTRLTRGVSIVDRITLALDNPDAANTTYEAENATLNGASTDYARAGMSGGGSAVLDEGDEVTFWAYSPRDAEASLIITSPGGGGTAEVTVNGATLTTGISGSTTVPAFLEGGINKVVLKRTSGSFVADRLQVARSQGKLSSKTYQAESATVSGAAKVTSLSNADGGQGVTSIGGLKGNNNFLTFNGVTVEKAGIYELTIRYSNSEQLQGEHYNPDLIARHADIAVNDASAQRVLFPHTYSDNNFWERTVSVQLKAGVNKIRFTSEELPNFDGVTYTSNTNPGYTMRSAFAPNIDRITVTSTLPQTASPSAEIKVNATASIRNIASKAYVAVTATNRSAVAVQIEIVTAYGKKSFASVRPNQTVSGVINSMKATIPAGKATVTATTTVDGKTVTSTVEAPYSAQN